MVLLPAFVLVEQHKQVVRAFCMCGWWHIGVLHRPSVYILAACMCTWMEGVGMLRRKWVSVHNY